MGMRNPSGTVLAAASLIVLGVALLQACARERAVIIESTPQGAAILIEGESAGKRTPSRCTLPREPDSIRFSVLLGERRLSGTMHFRAGIGPKFSILSSSVEPAIILGDAEVESCGACLVESALWHSRETEGELENRLRLWILEEGMSLLRVAWVGWSATRPCVATVCGKRAETGDANGVVRVLPLGKWDVKGGGWAIAGRVRSPAVFRVLVHGKYDSMKGIHCWLPREFVGSARMEGGGVEKAREGGTLFHANGESATLVWHDKSSGEQRLRFRCDEGLALSIEIQPARHLSKPTNR